MSNTLTGQVVGRAHYAARALLERELTRLGLSFTQSLALTALADGGADSATLIARLTDALKVDASTVRATLAELTDAGLVHGTPDALALTDTGRSVQSRARAAGAAIAARLYAGIPAEETAVAARVLTLLTERADAELAAAGA